MTLSREAARKGPDLPRWSCFYRSRSVMGPRLSHLKLIAFAIFALVVTGSSAFASEADLAIPDLWKHGSFDLPGFGNVRAGTLLLIGSAVICGTLGISLFLRTQISRLPAHKSMLDVAEVIFQTCKTY